MKIECVVGDVRSQPVLSDTNIKLIIHCCNDIGAMGAGVAKALYTKWPNVRTRYMDLDKYNLGSIQLVSVETNNKEIVKVINMIGQHKIMVARNKDGIAVGDDGMPPVRYYALSSCLKKIKNMMIRYPYNYELHFPKFGCDLAGGDWNIVSTLIKEMFYDLNNVERLLLCVMDESEFVYDVN